MDKKTIQKHFDRGDFRAAIKALEASSPSAWRDTMSLRCLRSLNASAKALKLADTLVNQLRERSTPYSTTKSERNNQRRYVALVFAECGQPKKACSILQALIKASPGLAALHQEYAFALNACGQLDLAEKELYKTLQLQPLNARAHAQLARIQCRIGRTQAGYDAYVRAASIEPDNTDHLAHLVYWSNYLSTTTQQSNYQLARLWASKAHASNNRKTVARYQDKHPNQQLRLGLVSSNLCAHAISFFVKPLLRGLNLPQFHITAYHTGTRSDAVTTQIRTLCDAWHDSAKLSSKKLGAQITQDKIDILLDMNGHSTGGRPNVFAQRLAPLQMSWLGYPSTSGLKNMDGIISDRVASPVGLNDDFYSESVLHLPNGFVCYEPLSTAPDVVPANNLNTGKIRFGSFNSLAKISPSTLDCWAAALLAVPNSSICVKRQQLKNEGVRRHFFSEFEKRGISHERVELLTSTHSIEEHLSEYNKIDIALDTTPYNGTTTTLEALWMGVPVLSMQGETQASRVSASILHRLQLSHLATGSAHEFAEQAANLSRDTEQLSALKAGLRKRMQQSVLLDHKKFGRDFGNLLRTQWRAWCQQQSIPTQTATTALNKDTRSEGKL